MSGLRSHLSPLFSTETLALMEPVSFFSWYWTPTGSLGRAGRQAASLRHSPVPAPAYLPGFRSRPAISWWCELCYPPLEPQSISSITSESGSLSSSCVLYRASHNLSRPVQLTSWNGLGAVPASLLARRSLRGPASTCTLACFSSVLSGWMGIWTNSSVEKLRKRFQALKHGILCQTVYGIG